MEGESAIVCRGAAIGRALDLDVKTIRRCVRHATWAPYQRAPRPETLYLTCPDEQLHTFLDANEQAFDAFGVTPGSTSTIVLGPSAALPRLVMWSSSAVARSCGCGLRWPTQLFGLLGEWT